MNYVDLASVVWLWDKLAFFIYGIICGYVIHFFEGEPLDFRNAQKIIIFGCLTVFARVFTVWRFKSTKEEEIIVLTMFVACTIYIVGVYVFKPDNRDKIGAIITKYIARKFNFDIEEKEKVKKIVIPKPNTDETNKNDGKNTRL